MICSYAYEADTHCIHCATKRFGSYPSECIDREGNSVHAISSWDEGQLDEDGNTIPAACGTCLELI